MSGFLELVQTDLYLACTERSITGSMVATTGILYMQEIQHYTIEKCGSIDQYGNTRQYIEFTCGPVYMPNSCRDDDGRCKCFQVKCDKTHSTIIQYTWLSYISYFKSRCVFSPLLLYLYYQ